MIYKKGMLGIFHINKLNSEKYLRMLISTLTKKFTEIKIIKEMNGAIK